MELRYKTTRDRMGTWLLLDTDVVVDVWPGGDVRKGGVVIGKVATLTLEREELFFDVDVEIDPELWFTSAAIEFELLRRVGPKLSMAQRDRMNHLENHLDAGDEVCNC